MFVGGAFGSVVSDKAAPTTPDVPNADDPAADGSVPPSVVAPLGPETAATADDLVIPLELDETELGAEASVAQDVTTPTARVTTNNSAFRFMDGFPLDRSRRRL